MIYKLQNGWTIPLGGDYLEYLQSIPETYGGSIQPSIKVESLPKKFNGSQQAARTYAEGYQKGAKPVTNAMNDAGQKIFNTTKNVAMFVPGPTGAITWLGQMGADTANGEYSKVAKDLGAAVVIGAGLKGAQVGAKAVGRTLAGKGINIPWLDAYDYSALRNEYLNRAAKRARIITPNKGWENLSNFDVYKDAFYNHPAIETTEAITEIPKHYTGTVGNTEDIHKLKMHPNSAIEAGYVNFIDDTKPFRKDLKGDYDIYRDGTTYMNGHPTKQGVLLQDLDGNEFLEYPRNSGVRYYTGHIKTEGYTPTLVHIGSPNMSGTIINPRIDPMKRLDKNYLWWQRNNPFWSHGNFTTRINDIVPSESAIDINRNFPTRLTGSIDLSDPKLDVVQMEFNPLTKTFSRVKYHVPQSTISPQEAATTYHFDGRMPLSRPISEAERLGISKAGRSTLNSDQTEAIDDLLWYLRNGRHKKYFLYNPETETFRWSSSKAKDGEMGAVRALIEHGATSSGYYEDAPVRLSNEYGNFTIWPNKNAAFTSNFPIPEGMKWGPGETSLMLEGDHGMRTILTSPRVDLSASMEDAPIELVNSLPNTIDKSIMRRFWSENDKMIRPGTYLSGDNGQMPLGNIAISAFDRTKSVDSAIQSIINPKNARTGRTGLSPDSYSSIIRQGLRGNHKLRWGEGFTKWNDSAVENRVIYEAWKKMNAGEITPEQYKQIFDDWAIPLGGRPVEIRTTPSFRTITDNNGITRTITQEPQKYVVMPHPYIMYRKQGGKI